MFKDGALVLNISLVKAILCDESLSKLNNITTHLDILQQVIHVGDC